jgi:hypothetical protein
MDADFAAPSTPAAGEALAWIEDEDLEAVIACLGDDAAALHNVNPEDEVADNMLRAVVMLERLRIAPSTPAAQGERIGFVRHGFNGNHAAIDKDILRGLPDGTAIYAAPSTPAAPTQCACGVPWTLGVVHRAKNPCFIYIEPADQSTPAAQMDPQPPGWVQCPECLAGMPLKDLLGAQAAPSTPASEPICALDALDMTRLRNGDRRMLNPENQPAADALTAARADASRYQFLCEFSEWPDAVTSAFDCGNKPLIDMAIDEAIAARAAS